MRAMRMPARAVAKSAGALNRLRLIPIWSSTLGDFRNTFPRLSGEPDGATTPEELLAASHAVCFGIGLRSVLAQRGGSASQLRVMATITADKGGGRIGIRSAHLDAVVEGLEGVDAAELDEIAREAEVDCTISVLLRATVPITVSASAG